ncbi:DUF2269 family protein [Gemmobacter denitrificans]|uniref:DUF2269 domain-containing protein n=1 Tax=Gemmobacter denitrificans TaxID=3123040 RepID=A0ABU8BRC5_9RHOB
MEPYLLAKWLHVLSSTVLFGTGIGTAFAMVWAIRSNRAEVVAHVAAGVVVADWLFTLPSGIVQPLTGLWLVRETGRDWNEGWLLLTYASYMLALACWLPVVRLQYRIRDLARAAAPGPLPFAASRAFRWWFALGWPAFGALVGVFWLMIVKPDLF